jgi:hypothetical protein
MSVGEIAVGGVGKFPAYHGSGLDGNVALKDRTPEAEGAPIGRYLVELPSFARGAIEADCRPGPVFGIGSFVEGVPGRLRTGRAQKTKEQQERAYHNEA